MKILLTFNTIALIICLIALTILLICWLSAEKKAAKLKKVTYTLGKLVNDNFDESKTFTKEIDNKNWTVKINKD